MLILAMLASALTTPTAVASAAVLEVFVRAGCPHCAAAEQWLATSFARRYPHVPVRVRDVGADDDARVALEAYTAEAGAWPPGVPTFVYAGRLLVGFDTNGDPDARFAALLGTAAAAEHAPGGARGQVTDGSVDAGPFGTIDVEALGLPLFTLALGLLDGFNPCAMWLLLFLLSMLVRLADRRRMALIAGTFVVVSGAVYYAFMAAWLNVFLVLGMSDAVRVGLALLALVIGALNAGEALRGAARYTLAIPTAARPGLYARVREIVRAERLRFALPAAAALAVLVNVVELLCTAGLPALYTAVLAQQALAPAAHYAYLALYIVAYMADDAVMVALAVLALSNARLDARGARLLKLLSGVVMLALGAVMLFAPGVLL
ncbi:MAG: glutaredoxin domain-containing protein [Gammaproteobacteria bacterium]